MRRTDRKVCAIKASIIDGTIKAEQIVMLEVFELNRGNGRVNLSR
jgi:hypothetical protein